MKTCATCGETKPLAEFPLQKERSGRSYPHSNCRSCRRAQCREWAKTERGKQVKRRGVLKRQFGLSEADYQNMHDMQEGRCAICNQPETKRHRDGALCSLCVDHDHTTGRVRGLLCSACNAGLGHFKESQGALLTAYDYLTTNNQINCLLRQLAEKEQTNAEAPCAELA